MNVTVPPIKNQKQALRKAVLEQRKNQPPDSIHLKSTQITSRLLETLEYKAADVVMLYSGKETEVQTEDLIRTALKDKRVILPITNAQKRILEISEIRNYDLELHKAAFNILEPKKEFYRRVNIDLVDLIVVPGVVFDFQGNRLGYGFGYYDKLLTIVNRPIPFIGLAFEFQLKGALPNSHHDVPVHMVITEDRVIRCRTYRSS
jgi:5-formyltetrahydrofolate cyclo-ligase